MNSMIDICLCDVRFYIAFDPILKMPFFQNGKFS